MFSVGSVAEPTQLDTLKAKVTGFPNKLVCFAECYNKLALIGRTFPGSVFPFLMKTVSTKKPSWDLAAAILLPVLVALVFLAFTFSYFPFREKLQFDTDEGLNLMRSMLVTLEHPLYSEVSSDQPPLFNEILAVLFRIVGFEVNHARFLVLLFSTFLVWAGAQFLQLTSGRLSAVLFLPLVVMVPYYLPLSVAVMIGVPSLAFAVASMTFLAVWHQNRRDIWLVVSGFMLSLSILIKLFTGFVAPIFFAGIVLAGYFDHKNEKLLWKLLRPALIWSVSFAGLAILLGLVLIGPQNVWSIIAPSLNAPAQAEFQSDHFAMNTHLKGAIPLLVLGFLGVFTAIVNRKWLMLYPLAWAGLAYVLFSIYSPVFYHHQLLITIPMAMLAASGLGDGISSVLRIRRVSNLISVQNVLGILGIAGLIWASITYIPVLNRELMNSPRLTDFNLRATPGKLAILRTMDSYADQTNWIVTDMPLYAFRVGKPVPPILATFSQKRLSTGSLTEEDILNTMREYQPEQVMMARFQIPALEDYLREHYTLVLSREFFRLFVRNDLKLISE